MRSFKAFDLFGQLVLALIAVGSYFIPDADAISSVSIVAFAALQVISLIVHALSPPAAWKQKMLRKIHLICTGIVLAVMLYGLFKPPQDKYDMSGLGVIVDALIPALITALFYTLITFLEWRKIGKVG